MTLNLSQALTKLNQDLSAIGGNWAAMDPDARLELQTRLKVLTAWKALAELGNVPNDNVTLVDMLTSPAFARMKAIFDAFPS